MGVEHPYKSLGRNGFTVLKMLAARGVIIDTEEVGRITNCDCLDVLEILEQDGLCVCNDDMWFMTPQGEEAIKLSRAMDCGSVSQNAREQLYAAFEPLDKRTKDIAHRWQMKGNELNDHEDADYDFAVLEALIKHHAEVLEYLARLKSVWPRMDDYRERLSDAIRHIENGELEYLAGVDIPSYHTLWFEMHEDLLNCCGKEREE